MKKEKLVTLLNELSKVQRHIVVNIDDFFLERDYRWSFAANVCTDEIDSNEFYRLFQKLKRRYDVNDIKILIYEIDDDGEGPYSDTAIVIGSIRVSEIYDYFGELFPDEIREIKENDEILKVLPSISENDKAYSVWWD